MRAGLISLRLMLLKLAEQEVGAARRPAQPVATAVALAERETENSRRPREPAAHVFEAAEEEAQAARGWIQIAHRSCAFR